MPGRVTQLLVDAGDTVRRGQPLMVIEAMKMEHTIAAPARRDRGEACGSRSATWSRREPS